jgi:hypothetical protein
MQQSHAIASSKLLLLLFLFQQDYLADTPDLHLDGVTGGWSAIVQDQTF